MLITLIEGFSYTNAYPNIISVQYPTYFQRFQYKKYDDRPYSTYEWSFDEGHYRYLNDDIHEWLINYNVSYKIIYHQMNKQRIKYVDSRYIYWIIDIQSNKQDIALLFKLTWGGKIFIGNIE